MQTLLVRFSCLFLSQMVANLLTAPAFSRFNLLQDFCLLLLALVALLFLLVNLERNFLQVGANLGVALDNIVQLLLVQLVLGDELEVLALDVRDAVLVVLADHFPADLYVFVVVSLAMHEGVGNSLSRLRAVEVLVGRVLFILDRPRLFQVLFLYEEAQTACRC